MPHRITALLVPGPIDPDAARRRDLVPIPLRHDLVLLHVTHHYTAYQQAVAQRTDRYDLPGAPPTFPREGILGTIAAELTAVPDAGFAIVFTDYFGGVGEQWAAVSVDGGPVRSVPTIDAALCALGVRAETGMDEFDTIGLAAHRSTPDHLDRYFDLCDDVGA